MVRCFGSDERLEKESAEVTKVSDAFWRLSLPVGSNRDHFACNFEIAEDGIEIYSSRFPATLVHVAGEDLLRPRAVTYEGFLKRKGVKEVELALEEGQPHVYFLFSPEGAVGMRSIIKIFGRIPRVSFVAVYPSTRTPSLLPLRGGLRSWQEISAFENEGLIHVLKFGFTGKRSSRWFTGCDRGSSIKTEYASQALQVAEFTYLEFNKLGSNTTVRPFALCSGSLPLVDVVKSPASVAGFPCEEQQKRGRGRR